MGEAIIGIATADVATGDAIAFRLNSHPWALAKKDRLAAVC